MSQKAIGPAGKGEAGVQRGSEPGPNTSANPQQQAHTAPDAAPSGSFDRDLFGKPTRPKYPDAPGHRGIDTSIEAAVALVPALRTLQQLALDYIKSCGALGATSDECAAGLGIDRGSVQPRTSELSRKGLIVDSGLRRRNATGKRAIVWSLPEFRRTEDQLSNVVEPSDQKNG